jgi:hypothetical protein
LELHGPLTGYSVIEPSPGPVEFKEENIERKRKSLVCTFKIPEEIPNDLCSRAGLLQQILKHLG